MTKNLKQIILFSLILLSLKGYTQNEAANWFFGEQAGMTFNNGSPVSILGGELETEEGCSTISDKYGNLLFYSDGINVWNKNHIIMPNGNGLLGDFSSTQSALIVPKPNSDAIFYLFTVDDKAGVNGLRYSEVDLTLDNGLGDITSNKNILLTTPTAEKITAVEHANGVDIWVISHKWNSNEFIAYLVSNSGINTTPIISAIGSMHNDVNNSIGYLKASPNGQKIACVKSFENNETQIFDFDASTGILTNPITISNYTSNNFGPYGCEFSPDSKLLYISEIDRNNNSSKIHQYNLLPYTESAIISSDIIIAQENIDLGALQQALDGRIYIAKYGSQYLGVITNPNEIGLAANYISEGLYLNGNASQYGLPPFIQSYFYATNVFSNTCYGDTTSFEIESSSIINNITWNFGDPASGTDNTSTLTNPTHIYSTPGDYTITISIDTAGETQTIYRNLNISQTPPTLNLNPLMSCVLPLENAEYNLLSAIPTSATNNNISFFENQNDAENNINAIFNITNYENSLNLNTIYVRLENNNFGDCYSVSELELIANLIPEIEETETVIFCKNSGFDFATLTVGNLPGILSDYSFLWLETLETTPEIQVTESGIYTVRITNLSSISLENPEGCYSDRTITVNASSIATIPPIEIFNNNSINITAIGLGDYEYALDDITGPYQDSNTFLAIDGGSHTVYVRDKNSCGIEKQSVALIGFPPYFTPNNDGFHDTWQISGVSETIQPNTTIRIYNRYGKLIKQISPTSLGWDGTFNGQKVPNDDYWFAVTLQDGREYFNHFALKR
ncbi:T9SS type B sorting domain-containing protein [Lacinutrix sp. WUR7]|uniref:T9SS type B sorting domain-containing protein n=1 Tax=Lacinutrix sp. WUR7 TaxID=2653681 RepID=UPI00193CBEDE|nr:T9SS type B sorting domain-containing protein [Lacinutrix sp. WUR7]QRM89669.1 T9SS type B sorting domain-containing protein [Lacinutrix sp. WUR7]